MYLRDLHVNNFRCLQDVHFRFQPGLNVIIGENNTGKSALIDAIRFVFSLGPGRRDIWAEESDIHCDPSGAQTSDHFEITADFVGLDSSERALLSNCLCICDAATARVGLRYDSERVMPSRRGRFRHWGGDRQNEDIDSEALGYLLMTYLEPLRDPTAGLQPGRASRIARLIERSTDEDSRERTELEELLAATNAEIEQCPPVTKAAAEINAGLQDIARSLAQTSELRLTPPDFRRIVQSLRAIIAGPSEYEIEQNGLGFNNLLYTATVLAELENARSRRQAYLAALLIEEPEAHLHPQLQSTLTRHFCEIHACEDDEQKPVVQTFVTSHSPLVASAAPLSSLTILQTVGGTVRAFDVNSLIESTDNGLSTLTDEEVKFLERFLDLTKAQLLFARGAILVEGISEALLLPSMARQMGTPLEDYGITLVNVQCLKFSPFARLFQEGALCMPGALITDSDPPSNAIPGAIVDGEDAISATAARLRELETPHLSVFLATKTLEWDLAKTNSELMAEVYEGLRPRKAAGMKRALAASDLEHTADVFVEHFDPKDKARFAQLLSAKIDSGSIVVPPDYLANAIRHVIPSEGAIDAAEDRG